MRALLCLSLIGCGGGTSDSDATPPTWWQDTRPIVEARCATCHVAGDIAPFPLTTLDEVRARAAEVRLAVELGTMPPWPADPACNDYKNDRSLTDAERESLLAWLDADLPEGDEATATEPTPPETFEPTLVVTLPEPYTPALTPDDYRCLLVPWPEETEQYIVGLRVLPDRADMVHHVIAYAASAEQAAAYAELDAAEDGPGYTCFGGPTGGSSDDGFELSSAQDTARWIGSWVPGATGGLLPDGTGIRMSPGDMLVVQMHYNTTSVAPGPDQSSIGFLLADQVARPAVMMPLTDLGWVTGGMFGEPMTIPAGDPDVTLQTTIFPLTSPLFSPEMAAEIGHVAGDPLRVHSLGLHMHTHGTSGRVSLGGPAGDETCLVDIPNWDFHWQGRYMLEESLLLDATDAVSLTCSWDNAAGDVDLTWGEGTDDEMCLSVLYVTAP